MITCACGCGAELPPPTGRGKARLYASGACRTRAYRRHDRRQIAGAVASLAARFDESALTSALLAAETSALLSVREALWRADSGHSAAQSSRDPVTM